MLTSHKLSLSLTVVTFLTKSSRSRHVILESHKRLALEMYIMTEKQTTKITSYN